MTALLIAGCVLLVAALILSFSPNRWSPAAAWGALVCIYLYCGGWGTWTTILFWAIVAALLTGISALSPADQADSGRVSNAYVNGGALVGALVGMIFTTSAAVIVGAAVGAVCGAFAFARTPRGSAVGFPSPEFLKFLVHAGLPATGVMSMIGLALGALLVLAQ